MDSNQSTIEFLNDFINSDRAEVHYGTYCNACGERLVTPESTRKAGEAKQLAAQLIVRLNEAGAENPNLWATVVNNTPFDNFAASVARGEYSADVAHNNYLRWLVEKGSQLTPHGHAVSLCPFGTPPAPPEPTEQIEARRERHREYWNRYQRKTPEMFKVQFQHHPDCPLAGSQTIP